MSARHDPAAGSGATGGRTLHVDRTSCRARGHCIELLPELLTADPWGYPAARPGAGTGRGDVAVPAQLAGAAAQAESVCPRLALRLLGPAGGIR